MRKLFAAAIVVACLSFAGSASAEPGYVNTGVNVRAGPGTDFPRVDVLQRGRQVDVRGCVRSRHWCDVDFRGGRGWVSARYLDINLDGRRRGYWDNRQRSRVPTISWNRDSYWRENYRGRDFNRDRGGYRDDGARSEPMSDGRDRRSPDRDRDYRDDRDWNETERQRDE